MRIKKIQAKNFRQALSIVRRELGADAVILSSEDKTGDKPYVEVTAAIDYDEENKLSAGHAAVLSLSTSENTGIGKMDGLTELRNEMKSLREYIESMRNNGFEITLPEERRKMFHFLRERSISEEFALGLVEKAANTDDLEVIMSKEINSVSGLNNSSADIKMPAFHNINRVIMLIGPTGVGKTTTVAKLASAAIREGKKVGLISIDTYKIGASEQIRIYARMIGIPLDIVSSKESLIKSIERFSDKDIILIDTSGHNPKDNTYMNKLRDIYGTGLSIETQLLLSTSSDNDFMIQTYHHYGALPINYVAFTKTDEAVKLGSIYNICRIYQKPVAYITTGQAVPGNIEFIDSKRLTNLILRTGSA